LQGILQVNDLRREKLAFDKAQDSGRECDDGPYKLQRSVNGDAYDPEREQNKPDQRVEHQRQYG
jgi:hypothetical protein